MSKRKNLYPPRPSFIASRAQEAPQSAFFAVYDAHERSCPRLGEVTGEARKPAVGQAQGEHGVVSAALISDKQQHTADDIYELINEPSEAAPEVCALEDGGIVLKRRGAVPEPRRYIPPEQGGEAFVGYVFYVRRAVGREDLVRVGVRSAVAGLLYP